MYGAILVWNLSLGTSAYAYWDEQHSLSASTAPPYSPGIRWLGEHMGAPPVQTERYLIAIQITLLRGTRSRFNSRTFWCVSNMERMA